MKLEVKKSARDKSDDRESERGCVKVSERERERERKKGAKVLDVVTRVKNGLEVSRVNRRR